MSWFRKKAKKPGDESQPGEAQAAIERAQRSIAATRSRAPEVNRLSEVLEARKHRNHFGESLEKAMSRR